MSAIIEVGASAQVSRQIVDADVRAFAELTGDRNPVHLDDAFAATTRFGKRIVHGAFQAGMISSVLGLQLPGPGCLYLAQSLQFKAPVYIGDTVTAEVIVLSVRDDKPIVKLSTICRNQSGDTVAEGEAVMFVPFLSRGGS